MKILLSLLALILAQTIAGADERRHLDWQDKSRSYLLHLPKGKEAEQGLPVVIVFHGGGGNAESMVAMSGMNELADEEGFVVVYPDGTGHLPKRLTFNGGICCGYAIEHEIDDVGFIAAILDELEAEFQTDPARVYLTGLSNGAIVSYYVAANLADRITAIAPVGGTMGTETCSPSRPVPILHVHGTDDQFLPVEGGYGVNGRTNFFSLDHTLQNWIAANRCEVLPEVTSLPDTADDGCEVEKLTWQPIDETGAEIIYLKIINGGHTWPGSISSPGMLGRVCQDVEINRVMWEFFSRHRID